MSQPLVSIITINYNNKNGLSGTINSVLAQTCTDYEYIIIDGGSMDGSGDLIRLHQDKLSYWVSERDSGIYDAMNKAIPIAKGNYLFFLNSGDCFADPEVLAKMKESLRSTTYDIVYGNTLVENKLKYSPQSLTLFNALYIGVSHQAMFLKKELFEKAGLYNTDYKIVADSCHLMLCLVRYNASSLCTGITTVAMERGGASTVSITENTKERHRFMQTEFAALATDYTNLFAYYKKDIFKRVRKLFLRKLRHFFPS
jgi:glycosyltransferase involved in cell wall biosynthesis